MGNEEELAQLSIECPEFHQFMVDMAIVKLCTNQKHLRDTLLKLQLKIDETDVFPSGTEVTASHIWLEKDTYLIKAKAQDPYGYESDWGTLEITIPRTKYFYNSLIKSLFQLYPRIYLVLKILLNFQI